MNTGTTLRLGGLTPLEGNGNAVSRPTQKAGTPEKRNQGNNTYFNLLFGLFNLAFLLSLFLLLPAIPSFYPNQSGYRMISPAGTKVASRGDLPVSTLHRYSAAFYRKPPANYPNGILPAFPGTYFW